MEKTWKPTVAGILDIVSGAFAFIWFIMLIIAIIVIGGATYFPGMEAIPRFVPGILWSLAIPSLIIGVLALIGGVYALQRKKWGVGTCWLHRDNRFLVLCGDTRYCLHCPI